MHGQKPIFISIRAYHGYFEQRKLEVLFVLFRGSENPIGLVLCVIMTHLLMFPNHCLSASWF